MPTFLVSVFWRYPRCHCTGPTFCATRSPISHSSWRGESRGLTGRQSWERSFFFWITVDWLVPLVLDKEEILVKDALRTRSVQCFACGVFLIGPRGASGMSTLAQWSWSWTSNGLWRKTGIKRSIISYVVHQALNPFIPLVGFRLIRETVLVTFQETKDGSSSSKDLICYGLGDTL